MVPRLSRGTVDTQLWARFITVIKEYYKDDALVELEPNYILFKVGEYPSLPFDGSKFLRFSSKVSGGCGHAETYIEAVAAAAKAIFGPRIQYWHESWDQIGHYGWNEVHESIRSYNEVRSILFYPFGLTRSCAAFLTFSVAAGGQRDSQQYRPSLHRYWPGGRSRNISVRNQGNPRERKRADCSCRHIRGHSHSL